ncbi:hypothetical protein F5Y03DRAFT_110624 [Xylaria venustula]|nr:hypothetical protein F5Y03DRAFT_110624 [Xylaria venustula]
MSSIFCCSSIKAYRPARLDHEAKFDCFMRWAKSDPLAPANGSSLINQAQHAVQLVRQVNYGPQESIRYFIPIDSNSARNSVFLEVTEDDLLSTNFKKLNSYKNFRCEKPNKFFELNLYQQNPTDAHHWRANLERPARDIDLALKDKEAEPVLIKEEEAVAPPASLPTYTKLNMFPSEAPDPPVPGHQISEVKVQEKETLAQVLVSCSSRLSHLKSMLQFTLPKVGASLGSSSLMTLLSLDLLNKELDLGLDYEDLWESELTSKNISIFLNACIERSIEESTSLTDTGDIVDREMSRIKSLKDKQVFGRVRFEQIVNRVLESDASKEWMSRHGGEIKHILATGPSQELLKDCRLKAEEMQQKEDHEKKLKAVAELFRKEPFISDESDDYGREQDYESYYDRESEKSCGDDYAACDKECGYCGKCDY